MKKQTQKLLAGVYFFLDIDTGNKLPKGLDQDSMLSFRLERGHLLMLKFMVLKKKGVHPT